MKTGTTAAVAAFIGACCNALPAEAGTTLFSGTAAAQATVQLDASCQPFARFRGIVAPGNGAGTSNLGSFSYTHNACTQGAVSPLSLQQGTFAIDFSNGGIFGTFTGETRPRVGTPGLNDQVFAYLITGGSGRYAGASGGFGNIGTVDTRGGPPSRLSFNFDGAITAAAVPEPTTWAMLILGFFAVGAALRAKAKPKPSLRFLPV